MIAFGTDVLANATYSAVNMYYFKYVLGREDLVSPVATAILVGSIISIPLLPPLTKLIGKKRLYWFGSLLSILPLAVMWIKPTAPVIVLMSMMGAFGFVSKLPCILGWARLPECSYYAKCKVGTIAECLLTSS